MSLVDFELNSALVLQGKTRSHRQVSNAFSSPCLKFNFVVFRDNISIDTSRANCHVGFDGLFVAGIRPFFVHTTLFRLVVGYCSNEELEIK